LEPVKRPIDKIGWLELPKIEGPQMVNQQYTKKIYEYVTINDMNTGKVSVGCPPFFGGVEGTH
jgi:hypothetical protein